MAHRLRILSSDDDEGIRSLLFSLLTDHGHEVDFARDSDEVFKNLGRGRYDLLILDVNTPGINGYKVAQKITENIINHPKILIFTARDIKEENVQFMLSGADAILRKGEPCDSIMSAIDGLFMKNETNPHPPEPQEKTPDKARPDGAENDALIKLNNDLQYCITRMTQTEDLVSLKNMRYEEFIRDLLKEKQRTEKNYLEFKRIEGEVLKLKNWGYAVAALSALAVVRAFFSSP